MGMHTHTHTHLKFKVQLAISLELLNLLRRYDFLYFINSGDGSLSVLNMRQCKLEERSDCSESELLCVTTVKVRLKIFWWLPWAVGCTAHKIIFKEYKVQHN